MKKWLCFCLCLMVLVGCRISFKKETIVTQRCSGIVETSYENVINNIENNVDYILYIGRSDCQDCIEFHPILEQFLKENEGLGVYYLDVKTFRDKALSEDATKEEKEFFQNIYDILEFDWTPTLQHRQGKDVLSKITYLNMDYYDLETDEEKANAKEKNLNEIYEWLKKECQ